MNSEEAVNYLPIYHQLLLQDTDNISQAINVTRKCLVQTYSASLQLLDSEDALDLLNTELDSYAKLNDVKRNSCDSSTSVNLPDDEWTSCLNKIDVVSLVNPLPCNQNSSLQCQKVQLFNQIPIISWDSANELKVRKIAKSFAPRCASRDKRINIQPAADKSLLTSVIQNREAQSTDLEEARGSECVFKTAREELNLQNLKKFGCRSLSQGNLNNQLGGGGQKRKLGTRRNVQNRFVSPMLSNSDSSEEMLPKSNEWLSGEVMDERLKNIEPRMVELIRSEIMDNIITIDWDDIAGLEFAKTAIQEAVVWPLLRPDIFTGLRKPPKGILLFGPPGTGKTLIGKCVASQSKSTFFSISASSLTSKWIGDGEKMVRALFAVARCHQPAVIFIDEIDSLLSQRSDTEHESSRRIKTEFLVQLDGATTDNEERILLIGATNRPQELDEAARRRFVKRLYIPLPEYQARLQLVTNLMAQERHNLSTDNVQEIAKMSDGYSGADMKNLCSEASLGPIRCIDMRLIQSIQPAEVRPVSMEDFIQAFSRVKSSVSPNDLNHYLAWNKTYGSG